MARRGAIAPVDDIDGLIMSVRGQRVILDADLARIYGVPTHRLNEQVKRNARRFPVDFRFQLTKEEWGAIQSLRSQIATLEEGRVAPSKSGRGRYPKYLPYAFTGHGALMAANVLNSERAVEMSVYVIRAFVRMRAELVQQQDLAKRLRRDRANADRSRCGPARPLHQDPAAAAPTAGPSSRTRTSRAVQVTWQLTTEEAIDYWRTRVEGRMTMRRYGISALSYRMHRKLAQAHA